MNKLAICFYLFSIFLCNNLLAQDLSFSKKGNQYYEEMKNPVATNLGAWKNLKNEFYVSYASDNERYPKEKVPAIVTKSAWSASAWRGEMIHTQIVMWGKKNIANVKFDVSDLVSKNGNKISSENIRAAFVRYVMADNFVDGCSQYSTSRYDSFLVADPIDIVREMPVPANSVRPVWLTISVPQQANPGIYSGFVTIIADKKYKLAINVEVLNKILPPSSEWKYDFDMWQYPAPIARIHDVELWSDEHFDLMREYYTYLSKAGQKVITANMIEQPWGLDHVHFDDPTLIKWIKKKDGTWKYDFSLFEKYIPFVMSCGIKERINCYTMITWDLGFIYFDEATGKNKTDTLTPGTPEYTAFWKPMITEFTALLKKKGWFNITSIAVDERPVKDMQAIIALLKSVDPDWKIALAGDSYHPEIENDIYDYCLASYLDFDSATLKRRIEQGRPTTFYTACVEKFPNGYTMSPPGENAWLAWNAAARGLTGYLFWAYNTWVANPLKDSRWRRYPAGELFQFYPGPRTSIRFEKIIEGIQDFEKIRILREELTKADRKDLLKKLDDTIGKFQIEQLKTETAADMLKKGKKALYDIAKSL